MAIVYATPTEIATYMGISPASLPLNILTVIEHAQVLIDYSVINKINDYYLNSTKTAIDDTEIALAVKNATCAQIEYWMNIGIDIDIVNDGNISSFSIGNFSMNFSGSGSGVPHASLSILSPRASRYLFLVGLMFRGISRN